MFVVVVAEVFFSLSSHKFSRIFDEFGRLSGALAVIETTHFKFRFIFLYLKIIAQQKLFLQTI